MKQSHIERFIEAQGSFIIDGALATELEKRGCTLDDDLWSARILLDNPEMIRQVHADYLIEGADCIITATYQASFEGFGQIGLDRSKSEAIFNLAVLLAVNARDQYWDARASSKDTLKPLVAASIGPYGAFLANGAEYTGDYGLNETELRDWHRPRWQVLARSQADLLACETIPSAAEANAYVSLLEEIPRETWLTFSCRDGQHLADGTPLGEVISAVERSRWVTGVGINCTAPRFIPSLIKEAQQATEKPILVYPNSGELFDSQTKSWSGKSEAESFGTAAREWRKLGAAGIGGCCRTTPAHIRAVSSRLKRGYSRHA